VCPCINVLHYIIPFIVSFKTLSRMPYRKMRTIQKNAVV
jgi:hypothetical protein